jgi:hypothetical protein|tara:strand:- start:5589 stop:6560 length:972 start_codon:yes stop_codon:yes gene_type:complete
MAYISYRDVPIYFGGSNTSALPSTFAAIGGNGATGVLATQVALNYTPNITPTRLLGDNVTKNSFTLAGAPNQTLSFSCFLNDFGGGLDGDTTFNPTGFTGDIGDLGATFRIGDSISGISGSGAFLTSYSYSVAPYSPIQIQADFAIYNPIRANNISHGGSGHASGVHGGIGPQPVTRDVTPEKVAHGAYSEIISTRTKGGAGNDSNPNGAHATGVSIAQQDIVETVGYQYSVNRLPIYKLGGLCVSEVEYITANQTLSIRGDNLGKIVPMTGDAPGAIHLALKDSLGTTHLSGNIDGTITAQNLSLSAGDVVRGDITILEPLK